MDPKTEKAKTDNLGLKCSRLVVHGFIKQEATSLAERT